ncbi:hypothetical protein [Schumannella sp. 10F1B-5-1]|uniref:hypothetical protein n=1 Tax=Schumannella sp. 10F1B-5-1 TaxID=2590780 RepID=UPI00113060FC|nr:hypothetical protein [Schumannella sp. 10F1B-5-1]TPW76719.1 hypothetical protein FJ658_01895 [Schumannella sp. 10F1B-5-1]
MAQIEDAMPDADLPATLTSEQGFTAALFMVEIYGDVEDWHSPVIRRMREWMRSSEERWTRWQEALTRALAEPGAITENDPFVNGRGGPLVHGPELVSASELPDALTVVGAFAAALCLIEIYGDSEGWDDDWDLGCFLDIMQSDPARWDDWKCAIGRMLAQPDAASEVAPLR